MDKERMVPDFGNNWVSNEAKSLNYTSEYGTFQKALQRYVEDKIIPVLANIIKQMDINDNLLILEKSPSYQNIWLNLFQIFGAMDRHVDKKFSFSSTFPFSYKIMLHFENLMEQVVKTGM